MIWYSFVVFPSKIVRWSSASFYELEWNLFFYYYFFNIKWSNFILFLNFTILYWFCQTLKWIHHRFKKSLTLFPKDILNLKKKSFKFYFLVMLHGVQNLHWPGIEPVFPSVEAQSLNHWTTGEVQSKFI